ncbi:MAG TPA: GlsB/YeaQ/YmgE family stress response membrane protein [Caulifigura sp.]|nr:GlsB/YeaQ/YmgE family stress response membrane protein [Caulifigura sp.]
MQIIGWIVFGLIVGAIAKLLYPGNEKTGCISTIALGILGSVVGGIIAKLIWGGDEIEPRGLILSVIGALIVLVITTRWRRKRIT